MYTNIFIFILYKLYIKTVTVQKIFSKNLNLFKKIFGLFWNTFTIIFVVRNLWQPF